MFEQRLRDALARPFEIRSFALSGLFLLAAFYTLYFARSFFLPIVLALLLNFLLGPIVRALKKLRIPEGLGAALVIFSLLGLFGFGLFQLAVPAYGWIGQAPQSLRRIEGRIRDLKRPVQTVSKATEQMEKITQVSAGSGSAPKVQMTTESLGAKILGQATGLVSGAGVTVILLFFLLASGDLFLRKLIKLLPSVDDKARAAAIARQLETEISRYLATITLINCVLGLAVWGVMSLLGVPTPLLWGVVAAFATYIPYLGAIAMITVLAMVGLLTFPDLPHALLPAGAFFALSLLEAYLLTPLILGRRLTLNPVVIFLALTFWGWMWGIAGALVAVPLMVVFKITCEHNERLAPIGEFLGS